jgi:hypothetical protein
MTNDELAKRIEASPRLKQLQSQLMEEVSFRSDSAVQFDPVTIIMLISIIVQVIIHCREHREPEELVQDIRDIRNLSPRRLMRLRRRLNAAWHNCCAEYQTSTGDVNPFLTAVYEIGENSDDETIRELIELAQET